eukprot:gene26476-35135_t
MSRSFRANSPASFFASSSRFIDISYGRRRQVTTQPCFHNRKTNELPSKIIRHSFSSKIITENLESLGDSITSAVLVSWAKEPGDAVKEDDVISIVETDKVTMDIRAKKNGVFVEGLVAAQSEIAVGSPLYKLDLSVTSSPPINAETVKIEVTPPLSKETISPALSLLTVDVPVMGESITTGMLAKWNVKVGDFVGTDAVVANIETDKVNVEVRSPQSGFLKEIFNAEGDEISVGNPLFVLSLSETAPATGTTAPPAPVPVEAPAPVKTPAKPAPVAPASAPAVKSPDAPKVAKTASPPTTAAAAATKASAGDRSETRVKMTRMRLRIASRLKEAQNTAAMLTTFQEVDMGNLMDLRNKYKDDFEKTHGIKLGFMSAFVRAATVTLQELPAVNGVIDDATNEIIYRNYVDISVAVASPNGLVVPVLRNTEKMNFADVERTIAAYGKKAKEGSLALEDMAGGTFTISNGGVFGSLFGTPIINPPQSAILGMHATKMRPVVVNGKVEARPMMYLALTYDHRLIDGREAVTFLKAVANRIEDPAKLLFTL